MVSRKQIQVHAHVHAPPHSAVQCSFVDKTPAMCFALLNSLSAVLLHLLTESASDYGVFILQLHAVLSKGHLYRSFQGPVRQDQTYDWSAVA